MKVKELIALLEKENPEALVLASSDSEGNTISKMDCSFSDGKVKDIMEDYTWCGYVTKEDLECEDYLLLYPEC